MIAWMRRSIAASRATVACCSDARVLSQVVQMAARPIAVAASASASPMPTMGSRPASGAEPASARCADEQAQRADELRLRAQVPVPLVPGARVEVRAQLLDGSLLLGLR